MVQIPPLKLSGGAGGSAGPSAASSLFGAYNGVFDSSGWTVSTSGSKATAIGTSSGAGASVAAAANALGLGALPWTLIIAAAAIFLIWKKR